MTKVNRTLDARGLSCPMPIMKSMQAIKKIRVNHVLEILTTDPGSLKDIPTWAKATGLDPEPKKKKPKAAKKQGDKKKAKAKDKKPRRA